MGLKTGNKVYPSPFVCYGLKFLKSLRVGSGEGPLSICFYNLLCYFVGACFVKKDPVDVMVDDPHTPLTLPLAFDSYSELLIAFFRLVSDIKYDDHERNKRL